MNLKDILALFKTAKKLKEETPKPAETTADNTARMLKLLERIAVATEATTALIKSATEKEANA